MYVAITATDRLLAWGETRDRARSEADYAGAWELGTWWGVFPATEELAELLERDDVEWLTVVRDDDVVDLYNYEIGELSETRPAGAVPAEDAPR